MTEQRLREMMKNRTGRTTEVTINLMKQAVNEALEEAANVAIVNLLPKTRESIIKLKVK